MLTDAEFDDRWARCNKMQRKFCVEYIRTFDCKQSARNSGYHGCMVRDARHRIYRKVQDICDYLIAKNNLITAIVKPEWVMSEYRKLFDTATDQNVKLKCLQDFSKILKLQADAQVTVTNNIPQTPVQIIFQDQEEKNEKN